MVGVYFPASPITVEQYKSIDEKLRSTLSGPIEGLIVHTSFLEGDQIAMFDVWESKEAFEALGATLMPIIAELGLPLSPPQFVEMIACQFA